MEESFKKEQINLNNLSNDNIILPAFANEFLDPNANYDSQLDTLINKETTVTENAKSIPKLIDTFPHKDVYNKTKLSIPPDTNKIHFFTGIADLSSFNLNNFNEFDFSIKGDSTNIKRHLLLDTSFEKKEAISTAEELHVIGVDPLLPTCLSNDVIKHSCASDYKGQSFDNLEQDKYNIDLNQNKYFSSQDSDFTSFGNLNDFLKIKSNLSDKLNKIKLVKKINAHEIINDDVIIDGLDSVSLNQLGININNYKSKDKQNKTSLYPDNKLQSSAKTYHEDKDEQLTKSFKNDCKIMLNTVSTSHDSTLKKSFNKCYDKQDHKKENKLKIAMEVLQDYLNKCFKNINKLNHKKTIRMKTLKHLQKELLQTEETMNNLKERTGLINGEIHRIANHVTSKTAAVIPNFEMTLRINQPELFAIIQEQKNANEIWNYLKNLRETQKHLQMAEIILISRYSDLNLTKTSSTSKFKTKTSNLRTAFISCKDKSGHKLTYRRIGSFSTSLKNQMTESNGSNANMVKDLISTTSTLPSSTEDKSISSTNSFFRNSSKEDSKEKLALLQMVPATNRRTMPNWPISIFKSTFVNKETSQERNDNVVILEIVDESQKESTTIENESEKEVKIVEYGPHPQYAINKITDDNDSA